MPPETLTDMEEIQLAKSTFLENVTKVPSVEELEDIDKAAQERGKLIEELG